MKLAFFRFFFYFST
ncbi:pheST operon leader peptide PheM [Xenorhabdus poinarii]